MMCDIMFLRVFLSCYKRILLSHQIIVSSRTHATSHPHSSSTLHYHSLLLNPIHLLFQKSRKGHTRKCVDTPLSSPHSSRHTTQRRNRRNKSRCGRKEENTGDEKGLSASLWCVYSPPSYFSSLPPTPLLHHHTKPL